METRVGIEGQELAWCVLRMDGRHTLRLADALNADGFDVWTPVEAKTIRIPRKNVKRDVRIPIMRSYVFARIDRLVDLLEMSANRDKPRLGAKGHTSFSVMRVGEKIPTIGDRQLQSLRVLEAKRTPRKKSPIKFAPGVEVRVKEQGGGAFRGMVGRVERSDHGATLVCFSSRFTVKIDTSLLDPNELWASSSQVRETAAKQNGGGE